jgi:hypothetical protein
MDQYGFSEFIESMHTALESLENPRVLDELNAEANSQQQSLSAFAISKKGQPYARDRAGQLAHQIGFFR